MTASPAIQVYNPQAGNALPLLADTSKGDMAATLDPANAATLTSGDYVLLFSNKPVDAEDPQKHAGEVKQVTAIDVLTGLITFDDQIFDAYRVADSAAMARITMLRNITLSDFSVTTVAQFYTANAGFTFCRFVENLQIERVEAHHAYVSGVQLLSVRNSNISDCYIHHIRDKQPPANVHYGITVSAASQNVSISGCRFSHTRHAVTTGGSSGTLQNGVQRNIVVSICTNVAATTAHFDTHQPAENVTFVGCAAIGGVPAISEAYGFQMRARNCSIIGCTVLQAIGRGIMIFGPVSSGAVISNNMIANVKAIGSQAGTGIYFDSEGTSNHSVTGNVIKNCEGSAVDNGGSNHDIVISGNVIENVNSVVPGAAVQLTNAARILICGNNIGASGQGRAIAMLGTSDDWRVVGNHFGGGGATLAGVGSVLTNNFGYNPVGSISNPWPSNGKIGRASC